MSDRIEVILAVPRDVALPVDVQGVQFRRKAIDLMGEIAVINENSVRYQGGSEDCTISLDGHTLSTWQSNLLAVRWTADAAALKGVTGPIVHKDSTTRTYSAASVVRDPYAA